MRIPKTHYTLIVLIMAQIFCAVFFILDVVSDYAGWDHIVSGATYLAIESVAALSLVIGIAFEVRYLRNLMQSKARLEKAVALASSNMQVIIETHFRDWKLTPTEQDIATFLVKGLSITEIAQARGTAEGTIKAHLNAIYKKSGARNRAEVMSILFESLMDGPLVTTPRAPHQASAA